MRRALGVGIATLAVVCACRPGDPPGPGTDNPPAAAAEAPDGARVFSRNCASCHGTLGRGDGPAGGLRRPPSFVDGQWSRTDDEIRTIVRHGQGAMPPFGRLSDAEVDAAIAHIRRLQDRQR